MKWSKWMNVFITVLCGISFMDAIGVSVIENDNLFILWMVVIASVEKRLTAIGRRWFPIKKYYSIRISIILMVIGMIIAYSLNEIVFRPIEKSWVSFFVLVVIASLIDVFFPVKPRQKKPNSRS